MLDGVATITATATAEPVRVQPRPARADRRASRWTAPPPGPTSGGDELVVSPANRIWPRAKFVTKIGGTAASRAPSATRTGRRRVPHDTRRGRRDRRAAGRPRPGTRSTTTRGTRPRTPSRSPCRTGSMAVSNGVLKDKHAATAGWTTGRGSSTSPMASYLATMVDRQLPGAARARTTGCRWCIAVHTSLPTDDRRRHWPGRPRSLDFLATAVRPVPVRRDRRHRRSTTAAAVRAGEPDPADLPPGFFSRRGDATDVIVHELAHQWFGDSVSRRTSWKDIWLNEGFATYAEWLWTRAPGPGTAAADGSTSTTRTCRPRVVAPNRRATRRRHLFDQFGLLPRRDDAAGAAA